MTRVEIVTYDERWPREFVRVAHRLRAVLGARALRVDHIGSTAVPRLDAKNRIDVQVTVASLADANALGGAGFSEIVPVADHRPAGASGGPDDWAKRFFTTPDDMRRANVHVRVEGRPNQRYPLLFRDYLRANADAAAAYGEVKRRLAAELRDAARYAEVKDPACDLIIVAAEAWAVATGWRLGPSDA